MMKKVALTMLLIGLMAAACGGQDRSFSAPMEPMDGGDMFVETGASYAPAADFDYAEEQVFMESESFGKDDAIVTSETGEMDVERVVIKNASMSIAVEDPIETMDVMMDMADEMGGFVVSSNLYFRQLENGAEVPQASVTLRVPAERLNEALDRIETGAGRLISKNVSGQDVTQEYTDLQSRLRNLFETEAQLLNIMDSATKTDDVLNVHFQLTQVREQIEVIQGRIQYFEQSAAFSMISLDILADEAVQPLSIGGWQPAGVAREAIQSLINSLKWIADALIWVVLWLLPVALVLGLVFYFPIRLLRSGWRRMRNARKARKAKKMQE